MDNDKRVFKADFAKVEERENGSKKIVGLSAIFNKLSHNLGGFREKIEPGAFKKAIGRSDARAVFNHNPDHILGRQSKGTLVLKETDDGLQMTVTPPPTTFARDLAVLIDRGDIDEQSFAFTVKRDSWDKLDTDEPIRTINEVEQIYDVGPVTTGAYQETTVALRSLEIARSAAGSRRDECTAGSRGTKTSGNDLPIIDYWKLKTKE